MRRLGHDHTADGRTANRYRTVRFRHAPPPRLSLGSLATPDAPGVSFSHDLGWAGKLLVLPNMLGQHGPLMPPGYRGEKDGR